MEGFGHIHPVNFVRGHGSDIQEVSGSGNFSASDTVSHPAKLPKGFASRRQPQRNPHVLADVP